MVGRAVAQVADAYEPDNTYTQASTITSGVSQQRTFHIDGDEDWVMFWSNQDQVITVTTSNLGPGVDTILSLHWVSAVALVTDDDGGGGTSSKISYSGPTGLYRARVVHKGATGLGAYTVTVSLGVKFQKTSPVNGFSAASASTSLGWTALPSATAYEYCIDSTNDNACGTWSAAATSVVTLNGLTPGTTYYWQVRAMTSGGMLYADGSPAAFASFTTHAVGPDAFEPDDSVPQTLLPGVPQQHTFHTSSDRDLVQFAVAAGEHVRLWTSNIGGAADTRLSAFSGNVIPSDDDGGGGLASYVAFTAQQAGTHVAQVLTSLSGDGIGSYTLNLEISAPGILLKTSPGNGARQLDPDTTLRWAPAAGATGYEYCVDTTDDGTCSGWTPVGTALAATLSGLSLNTTYYWQVRASTPGGVVYADGSPTAFWSFATWPVAPESNSFFLMTPGAPVPRTFHVDGDSDTGIFSLNTGQQFHVIVAGQPAAIVVREGDGFAFHGAVGRAGFSTLYDATIRQAIKGALGAYTATVFVDAQGSTAFGKVSPADGAVNRPVATQLAWLSSIGATGYEYCIDTTDDDACSTGWVSTGTLTSSDPLILAPATTYSWHVRAQSPSGLLDADNSPTAFWSFTTSAPPGTFGKMGPADGATGQLLAPTLSWSAAPDATGYVWCIDTTNDDACTWSGGLTVGTSVPVSLLPSTTYYWHVRGVGGGGTTYADGGATAFWSFTTQPGAPIAFEKTGTPWAFSRATSAVFSWLASPNATSYEYCVDTIDDSACTAWTPVGAALSVTASGLSPSTRYYWQIRAVNALGTTDADGGTWRTFTTKPEGADFNGDGKADLLFQHQAGALYAWFMDGAERIGGGFLQSAINPLLRVVGLHDFTGDGKPDVVFQNQSDFSIVIHIMDGLTKIGEQVFPMAAVTPWRVVVTGDIDNDGHADLVWQHTSSREVYVWYMKPSGGLAGFGGAAGAFRGGPINAGPFPLTASQIPVGTGDADGNGTTDLFIQDETSGALRAWLLQDGTFTGVVSLSPSSVAPAWRIRAVADYDGNGTPDFDWQHVSSGVLYQWLMNGTALGANGYLSSVSVNTVWLIAGPR